MCYIPYRTQSKKISNDHFPNLSFHNNLPYPPPYSGYPDWESVTLCKYQHYPTLDTNLSLSFHSDTLPEYLPYPTNRKYPSLHWVSTLPTPSTSHRPAYLYLPHTTFYYIPNLHFPTLYYCQGLIKYRAETTYQIRPKTTQDRNDSGRYDLGRNDSRPKWLRPKRPENAVAVVEHVELSIWLYGSQYLFGCEYSGLLIYLL